MQPQDEQLIKQWLPSPSESQPTIIMARGNSDIGEQMTQFCEQIKALNPVIHIKKDGDLSFPAPVLVVGRHHNIAYQAVPGGKILAHFLEALQPSDPDLDPKIDSQVQLIDLPVNLKLYVASHCPHCPQCIGQMQSLASASPLIRLNIINAELFSKTAQDDQIRSVPTLILDDQVRWSGDIRLEELLNQCIQRDPAQLSPASLRQLIEAGDADRLAAMMIASEKVFPALVELLVHQRWSVRLGAMVTAEYLAEEAPSLGLELCNLLWKQFDQLAPQVQGDAVQVLGQIPCDITRSCLNSILSGEYDAEVITVAKEVLEEMGDQKCL